MSSIYNMADTWNAGGTTFTAIKMNVTDTASADASLLMDLQIGGVSNFVVGKKMPGSYSGVQPYLALTPPAQPNASFALVHGPNGGNAFPVPTLYPMVANKFIAFDLCPNGTPTDTGYGTAWNDICNKDQIVTGVAGQSLHLSAGTSTIDIAMGTLNGGSAIPLVFGQINLDSAAKTNAFKINTDATTQFITNTAFGNATPSSTSQAVFAAGATGKSPLRLTAGVAPTSPVDGDIWYTGSAILIRVGGTTRTFTVT